MAKKKTSVLLPGGIQGLVHDLQNGKSNFAPKVIETTIDDNDDEPQTLKAEENTTKTATADKTVETSDTQHNNTPEATAEDIRQNHTKTERPYGEYVDNEPNSVEDSLVEIQPAKAAVSGAQPASSTAAPKNAENEAPENAPVRGRKPKENTMREYHIVKDNSADSWELFLDMATQYKNGGGKLATIYIDESLKNVLDRMKYAGQEKLSTSAILSSIVARFVYDHEDEIKKVLYSDLM